MLKELAGGSLVESELADEECGLLSDLRVTMLHERRGDSNEICVDHLISGFLMVNQLIKSLESISALSRLKVVYKKYVFELFNSTIEDSDSDLVRLYIVCLEGFLKVGVSRS